MPEISWKCEINPIGLQASLYCALTLMSILNVTAGQEYEYQLPPNRKAIALCPTYRTPYQRNSESIGTMGIPEDQHLYTVSGEKPRKEAFPLLSRFSRAAEVHAWPGLDTLSSTCYRTGRHNGPWELKKWNGGTLPAPGGGNGGMMG